jgi:hypothetical protein
VGCGLAFTLSINTPRIMKIIALLSSFLLAWPTSAADDIRSKVADVKDYRKVTTVIDTDKSIYDVPFGTTEDKFIQVHGKPMGYVRLSAAETTMIYGKSHAFMFEDGKLVGVRISDYILDWKLTDASQITSPFDRFRWRLSNGIEKDMTLKEAKKILGDTLVTTPYYQYRYMTDRARVELDFAHHQDNGDGDDAYSLCGIFVRVR